MERRLPSLLFGGGETSESPVLWKGGSQNRRQYVGGQRRIFHPRRAAETAEVTQRYLLA